MMGQSEVFRNTAAMRYFVNLYCSEDVPTAEMCYQFNSAMGGPSEGETNKVK